MARPTLLSCLLYTARPNTLYFRHASRARRLSSGFMSASLLMYVPGYTKFFICLSIPLPRCSSSSCTDVGEVQADMYGDSYVHLDVPSNFMYTLG